MPGPGFNAGPAAGKTVGAGVRAATGVRTATGVLGRLITCLKFLTTLHNPIVSSRVNRIYVYIGKKGGGFQEIIRQL
jgi:hypothetical protein